VTKRFVLLVLILCLASASQAGVIGFYIDGEKEYAPTAGEIVNIELIADEACSSIVIDAIVEGNANIATEVIDMDGELLSYTFHPGFNGIADPGFIDNYQGVLLDTLSAYAVPSIGAGEVLLTLEYQLSDTWDGVTDYWISPIAEGTHVDIYPPEYVVGPSYGVLEGVDVLITGVHLIPEPMTIALLGLGVYIVQKEKIDKIKIGQR